MSAPATAQPLKLEVGRAYRTRDGRMAVITEVDHEEGWRRGYVDGAFIGWHPAGEFDLNKIEQSPHDLIAEWGTPDADGWIQWSGGPCPVPPETVVQCRGRKGHVWNQLAATLYWNHPGKSADIIAYRIVNRSPVFSIKMPPLKSWTQHMAEEVRLSVLRQHSSALSTIMAAWEARAE